MLDSRAMRYVFSSALVVFIFTLVRHIYAPSESPTAPTHNVGYGHSVKTALKLDFSGYSGDLGTIQSHLSRSENHYQAMVRQRPYLMETYGNPEHKSLFPCNSHDAYWRTPFSVWDLLPASFNCPYSLVRLGRLGDGGKWLCGLEKHFTLPETRPVAGAINPTSPLFDPDVKLTHQPGCIIYSFGIQYESSFEREMLLRTSACQVWGYDFSVSGFGPQLRDTEIANRAFFTQASIAGSSNVEATPPQYSILDLMVKNGHDHIDIMKMDIEEWEFVSMANFIEYFLKQGKEIPVSQFLVEVHLNPGGLDVDDILDWWTLLERAGFRPVWTEPNLLVTTLPIHDGMPRYSEYTFINIKDSKSPLFR